MSFTMLERLTYWPLRLGVALGCWPWIDHEDEDQNAFQPGLEERKAQSQALLTIAPPDNKKWPDNHFAISGYDWKPEHFFNLTRLPVQDRLMAKALSSFENTRPDYADPEIPYENSFSFKLVLESLRQLVDREPDFRWTKREYYVVAYYSTLRIDLRPEDRKHLAYLDEAAFREALPSQAFIRYWFGKPDQQGRNLATCLWTDRNVARRTLASGPLHRRAAIEGKDLYQPGTIDIREYTLTIDADISSWSLNLLSRRIHA